MVTEICKKEE